MRGLNLLELQGAIPSTNPTLQTEMNVQIANIANPWSANQRIEECSNRLQHSKLTSFQFIRDSQLPELKENVVRVIATDWLENEIEAFKSMQN
jgi:hypothetical protein